MANSTGRAGRAESDDQGHGRFAALATSFALEQLDAAEQRILALLGASVLNHWSALPHGTRQRLMSHAAGQAEINSPQVKAQIARFMADGVGRPLGDAPPVSMRPGITRGVRDDDDFVDRAKTAYKQDGGAAEPAHYSHINEFDGKRVVVLRNKRGVLAVYEDVDGQVTRLAHWPVSWV
ncbi:MAG TPA: hypothetical protein VIR28_10935 [Achromobacter sp.]|uniref:hypothetical protein n=1 Tax=unclassified Achromobacter TaxID=2626865 RepID=UPI000CFDFC0B|nr:hypothetical protein [Achromobacter sp. MYb9]PQZ71879.1 hypothetical protein CQ050_02230 [Achromobacter sp. MYb9]